MDVAHSVPKKVYIYILSYITFTPLLSLNKSPQLPLGQLPYFLLSLCLQVLKLPKFMSSTMRVLRFKIKIKPNTKSCRFYLFLSFWSKILSWVTFGCYFLCFSCMFRIIKKQRSIFTTLKNVQHMTVWSLCQYLAFSNFPQA